MSLRQRSSSLSSYQLPSSSTTTTTTAPTSPSPRLSPRTILSQALESSGHLANFLPTGTLLAFQLLTPIFTKNGLCDSATRPMTLVLLVVFSLSCFIASFTDSVKSSYGKVHYGLVTKNGIWLFDNTAVSSTTTTVLSKYRLSFMDVVHAILSVLVFISVALKDKNVVRCFYPMPDHEAQEVLDIVPIGIGFIASLLFVVFPTKRHGIGYPITPDNR